MTSLDLWTQYTKSSHSFFRSYLILYKKKVTNDSVLPKTVSIYKKKCVLIQTKKKNTKHSLAFNNLIETLTEDRRHTFEKNGSDSLVSHTMKF